MGQFMGGRPHRPEEQEAALEHSRRMSGGDPAYARQVKKSYGAATREGMRNLNPDLFNTGGPVKKAYLKIREGSDRRRLQNPPR